MNEITKDEVRPLTDVELDAVTGGLANAWLDWIADNFQLVKMEAQPTVIECGNDRIGARSGCVTTFGVRSDSMGNVRASWQEWPPISVASLQSSSERGVQAAT